MPSALLRRKPVARAMQQAEGGELNLRRSLGVFHLTALGIGAIIGAGIFSATGSAAAGGGAHLGAGPGLIVSYALTAVACGLAALCYAELASMIPLSGSAYTYAYVTLGELVAWIVGWDLILEYAVGNVAVAVGWSGYFQDLLSGFGVQLPAWASHTWDEVKAHPELFADAPRLFGVPVVLNLPAAVIVAFVTVVLVIGIKESAVFNTMLVIGKLALVIGFVAIGVFYVKPENWHPFAPNGWSGILSGSAIVFFSYIGFDAVSTAAEETRNPQKDLPRSIFASLVICTVLYMAVAAVLTGMVHWTDLGVPDALSEALRSAGLSAFAGIFSFGAVIAMTTVLLVFQLGQPRIFFSMARDGLLPGFAARVHPKFRTPHITTILTGVFVGTFAMFVDINDAIEFTNIGTLFSFALVSAGVIALRKYEPDRPRPFRCPFVPWVPILSIASCVALMALLPWITWIRFFVWLAIGLIIYFVYSRRRAALARSSEEAANTD